MIWIIEQLRRLCCGLSGHRTVFWFEPDRLSLRCLTCSYQTPGWDLRPETLYVPSSTDDPLRLPAANRSRPLMLFDDRPTGDAFAHRSTRADRFAAGPPRKSTATRGDRPGPHEIRLAS